MPDDVVQLHVDAMNDMLATRAASAPGLTGHKPGSAAWIAVQADAAARTPAATTRRRQNEEAAATRQNEDAEIKRRRRAEVDAAEERSRVQFDRLERSRYQQERDDLQQLDKYWHRLFRIDPEEEIHWLVKRVNELPPSKRQRLMQHLS